MALLDHLIEKGIITESDISSINGALKGGEKTLETAILERGVDSEDLLNAKGELYSVPVQDLEATEIPFDTLKFIPEESAQHYEMVPLRVSEGFLEVGMVDPDNIEAKDALSFITARGSISYKIFAILEKDFNKVLETYNGLSGQVKDALGEYETELDLDESGGGEELDHDEAKSKIENETEIIEDAPVTKIVATILRYAVEGSGSDVHVEPLNNNTRVRFRVDGVLNTSLILPKKVHSALVARIKILAKLKLDEKRKPQDGRFSAKIDGRKIDFRVSTFPVSNGEKVVMRILDQEKGVKDIDEVGFSDRYLGMIKEAIDRPYGLILVSGPTGSGKSTTLYSLLKEVDREKLNVLSLEDPVEYNIDGISQSQVHADIGYTFATGLRTTLRQDPDIIMVGEIRDAETAALAIQAALTGHLVLSTIHTNTSAGIVPRLIDMGVDPFLIPPTLILGIGQRLVRKICPDSGIKKKIEGSLEKMINKQFSDLPDKFRGEIPHTDHVLGIEAKPDCPTGTRGREAVFEMFEMDRDIENIILTNPVESAIQDEVRKKGMITMKEHALIKALEHKIPIEEADKL